jgi:hypothetical protein
VDREQRELYRLTIRLSDTLHTTDISQILLVGFPYFGLAEILVSSIADPDPVSGILGLFDPWTRIQDPGSGIGFFRIPDLGSRITNPYF